MELSDYLRVLRKRWILILVLTLGGLTAGAGASIFTTPLYQASTLVFVSVQSTGAVTELVQGNNFAQGQIKSYVEVVSTPKVLGTVIDDLELSESAAKLAESIDATAPLDTVNIRISVTRSSPREAADIANSITASFRQVIADITEPNNGDSSPVSVSVLASATVPTEPVSPNTKLNLALGALVGVALGLGLAVLLEVLDTRVRGERDVRAITDAPILGRISFDRNSPRRPLIVQDEPNSPRAESFRAIRTNMQFLDIEGGARSFVITSGVAGEGKSTSTANLAITMAQAGANVVVIDADLRQSSLADVLGLDGTVGLTDVLIGRVLLADALQEWGNGRLTVLPAGACPPNPSELLGSQAMVSLLRFLEEQFDAVLIDASPLLPVTDAALLARQTRGALLVVAAGRTRRGELAAALQVLANVDSPVAGIIITMLPTRGADAYGYGYGNYGYRNGYGTPVAELSPDRFPANRVEPAS